MQIFVRMSCDGNAPLLFVVLELAVTAAIPRQLIPSVVLDPLEYVSYFHNASCNLV